MQEGASNWEWKIINKLMEMKDSKSKKFIGKWKNGRSRLFSVNDREWDEIRNLPQMEVMKGVGSSVKWNRATEGTT